MTSLIIDTSVAVKWLNQDNEEHIEKADKILEDVRDGKVELFAPELLKYEVGNALLFGKKISSNDIKHLMSIFYSLPITFVPENIHLANETYSLAQNFSITYYYASFMSLAKEHGAILITENIKHQGKSQNIKVKSLGEY